MDIKQLESQVKALAPVIKGFVDKAINALRTELKTLFADAMAEMDKTIQERIAAVKQAFPAPDERDLVEADDIKALIDERLLVINRSQEEVKTALKEYQDSQEFTERNNSDWMQQFDQVVDQLRALQERETLDQNTVKTLISEQFQTLKADLPVPENGQPGEDGRPGRDGKDATQLQILPAIDFDKSYPRDTYALHNGGMMRAYQTTQGEKGWEVVQNGVAGIDIEQKNDRQFEVVSKMTDGSSQKTLFSLPVAIYRNTYREESKADYLKGDLVQFGGSIWHADIDHPPGKPGTGAPEKTGWSLAVKKGRDGKSVGGDK